MGENPFLSVLKILAFAILAFWVLMVFWQRTELEDKIERLIVKVNSMEETTQRAAGATERLEKKIRGSATPGTGTGGGLVTNEDVQKPENYAWGPTPPPWVKGRAAGLWGKFGDNFLLPDPDLPKSVSVDDPRGDPEAEVTFWYGSNPPDTNAVTLNESDFNTRVRQYCSEFLATTHTKNGYRYAPQLAYRVEHSEDRKQWVVWLRPGVKWHTAQVDLEKYPHLKGEHFFTAHDWKFTMDCIMDETVNAAHHRAYFDGFDRCEVVDDHCFIMHWSKPTFTAISSNLELSRPFPKFVYGFDENGNEIDEATRGQQINEHWFGKGYHFVGTGPYFVREFRKEDVVICERFADYWGELPSIKRRVMQIINGTPPAQTEFEAGKFAYQSYRLPDFKKKVQTLKAYQDGKIGEAWVWSSSFTYIGYKNTHRIFKDVKVRRAMTHACNRTKILDLLNEGHGQILTGPSYWRAPTAPKDIVPLAFDLEKARALLKEAGWVDSDQDGVLDKEIDGERVAFEVEAKIPSGSPAMMTIFNVFKEDLLKIGVKVDVKTLQWAQYLKEVTDDRNFEICALGWNTSGWDNDFTQIWDSKQIESPKSSNHIEFSDPEVDRLIETAKMTFDETKRIEVQGNVHRRLNELQPYTFLFTLKAKVCWWKDQISNLEDANKWYTRPFMRLWPVYVPMAK
ncbi:MAG: ABC transporter substrate-binding protein [Planctomycetota bacterium]|nr:ABC transporter substrate-binding protein [Planctomycetota bacterium]